MKDRDASQMQPGSAQSWVSVRNSGLNLEQTLTRAHGLIARGRFEEALSLLYAADEQAPNDWRIQEALGKAWLQDGRLQKAAEAFERSVNLEPSRSLPHLFLADVHSAMGERQRAEQAIRQAIRLSPKAGHAWLRLAHLRRFRSKSDPDLRAMRSLARDSHLAPLDKEALHFALGKANVDLGSVNDAFAHLRIANEMHKKREPFDMKAMEQLVFRIEKVCDQAFFSRSQIHGHESSLPVFIVGMPRSGSSLVEQILASHPKAHGVGELTTLARLTADLPSRIGVKTPFPECLKDLDQPSAQALASDYLRRLLRDAPEGVLRVCDKMLSHSLLIGMIAVVFPHASIVHCKRNLMDLGLSIFMQSFAGPGMGYAYDLDSIGRYFQITQSLMAHWKRVCPTSIIEIEYEALVQEPEARARGLVEAVGLSWHEDCLGFHQTKRQVRTVSHWQVRQPIHKRSVERWRPYSKHLDPLKAYTEA